jgi:muconolactone delta-isomerase
VDRSLRVIACKECKTAWKEGTMLYLLDFHIEYPATMSQKEFFSVLLKEAETALSAKKAGIIVDVWKCVGIRRVVVVVNVDGPDMLDELLIDLPIMREHGQHVHVYVTPLRRYEDWASDLKKRLEGL